MRLAQQSGYILLPVVVVITLVAAIALLMNTESALESNTAASELDAQRAQYVAAAGFNHALWRTQQQGCGPYTDLTDEALGNDSYSSKLTTDLGSTTTFTISVDQDSWIRSDLPTENKGLDLKLHTRNETLGTERLLLRYDLSPITPKAQVLSATAWFYITNAHAAGPIDIHLTSADWIETDVTWDSMNANMDSVVLATIPSQPDIGKWIPVNLTALVQAWVNGQTNFGITLNSTVDGVHGQYNSRESANPPYLEVVVGAPPSSPATLIADATLANGVQRSINRNNVTLRQHPAGFSLARVTTDSGQDAMLDSFYNNRDYGVHELEVSLGSGSTLEHSLLQFELPPIAPGARIISAQLELYHYVTTRSTGTPVVDLYRVTRGWVEGTHDGTGTADGASWDTWDGSSNWTSAGGDYQALSVASGEVSPATGDWESWEIRELVQGWVDGRYSNHGLLLKGTGDFDISFASREDADAALHPKLSITYACACSEICVAPQGGGNVLMVAINPTTLVAEDQKAKDLFESWGYTVNAIGATANQADFDNAFLANDVVFVSETVTSGTIGSKLVDAPIGVVSQDGDYNGDLGFSVNSGLLVGSAINVTDTDHYITMPFAAGPLEIYANGMEQLTVNGAEAAGLQTLADSSGAGSLVVLDSGAEIDGGNAAGRRVMLPLGTRYRFDWDYLNANGRLLVQRALTWGAGLEAIKPKPQLLLVVADPAALTAQESASKTLIEGWGYDVTLIDDSDSQANFDAAVALADVAYVVQEIISGELGTKLREATVGVVIEEEKITDEFGISSGDITFTDASIEITDNTHYISQPFSLGSVAFATTGQPVGGRAGTLAPGLSILGQRPSTTTSMLDVIDLGGALFDTGTAAGRRVKLPWGGNGFDINQLTDDGRTIMQRAIEWAASISTVAGPIAHWKLDDATGLTAIDSKGGHDGTLSNNGPVWGAGRIDGGLVFDGIDDFIDVAHDDTLLLTAGMTFTAWANSLDSGGGYKAIVSKDAPGNGASNYWFGIENDELVFGFWASGAFATVKTGAVDLSAGNWYHLAASFDNVSDAVRLYVDGVEVQAASIAFEPTTETANLFIGKSVDGQFWQGSLDDVRIYDRALSANEIATLYAEAPVILDAYEETYQPWTANNDNVWEVVDLAAFGVPPNAVVEVAVINADSVRERSGGVRAVGSALDRQLILHEAESGGSDVMIMHVQANAVSQIEHYVESSARVSFILLGYWNSGSFVESWNDFAAAGSFSWDSVALSGYGVPAGAIVEVLLHNDNTDAQFRGGVRTPGSAAQRLINLHEAESGGNEIATMLVTAGSDASASIEVYSESVGDVDFYLSGYWDNPPGVFTETFTELAGLPAGSSSWEDASLAAFGVPADAVVSIMLANSQDSAEAQLGVRRKGSILARNLELQEAEPNGDDLGSMHALTDGSSIIQLYDQNTTQNHRFYLMGWWQTSP